MKGMLFFLAVLPLFASAQAVLPVGNQALTTRSGNEIVASAVSNQVYQVTRIEGEGKDIRFTAVPTMIREPLHSEDAIFYSESDKALYIERETGGEATYQVFRGSRLLLSGELHLANEVVSTRRWKDGDYTVVIQDSRRKLVRELLIRECDN